LSLGPAEAGAATFPAGGAAGEGHDTAGAGVGAVPDGAAETGCATGALSPLVGHGSGVLDVARAGSGAVTTLEPRLRNHADSSSRKIGSSIVSSGNAPIRAGSAAGGTGAGAAGAATGWVAGAGGGAGLGGALGCEVTRGGG
jgi:hypothetical protein